MYIIQQYRSGVVNLNLCFAYSINELDDESCMRNGRPTAHYMYGLASSMNAANYGYFLALQMAEQMDQSNVSRAIHLKYKLYTISYHQSIDRL